VFYYREVRSEVLRRGAACSCTCILDEVVAEARVRQRKIDNILVRTVFGC